MHNACPMPAAAQWSFGRVLGAMLLAGGHRTSCCSLRILDTSTTSSTEMASITTAAQKSPGV